MSVGLRFEVTRERYGDKLHTTGRLVEPDSDDETMQLDHEDINCCKAIYCSPVRNTSGKVARVALCTATGALFGAAAGAPFGGIGAGPGAAIGAIGGFTFGVCTILQMTSCITNSYHSLTALIQKDMATRVDIFIIALVTISTIGAQIAIYSSGGIVSFPNQVSAYFFLTFTIASILLAISRTCVICDKIKNNMS